MALGPLLVFCFLAQTVVCDSTFRFGAVLGAEGHTRDVSSAARGYDLYFDTVNALSDGRGFWVQGKPGTQGFFFRYQFIWRDDFGDRRIHEQEVSKLLEQEKIHFLGGSYPEFADNEMRRANESNVLCYHCCVSPDAFYERDYRTSFGIAASNSDFTLMLMRRLSFENVTAMSIIYQVDNEFTRTTCEAAYAFAEELGEIRELHDKLRIPYNKSEGTPEKAMLFAQNCKENRIEAVIACVPPESGRVLLEAFHEIRYQLKAFFLTTGPTRQSWIDSFEPHEVANDLLSAAQWHAHMKYSDGFFGSTKNYVKLFKKRFRGETPDSDAAGASAVGVTLTMAITSAFLSCDISKTNGDADKLLYDLDSISCDDDLGLSGYDRVLKSLAELDAETFFGKVKFNSNRRNIGLHPVTTQVFERRCGKEMCRSIEPVLPIGHATELFRFPAVNRYKETCQPGQFVGPDAFQPCELCPAGEASRKQDADHCDNCPIAEWMDKMGQSSCNRCPLGTFTNFTGATRMTDCICKPGYFNNGQLGVECQPCPDGATCEGGTRPPIPNSGHWANMTLRGEVYPCDDSEACLGGENSACQKGYTGRLCSTCEDGYFSIFQRCFKCIRASVIVISSIGLLIGWYVANVIVSRSVASLEVILSWAQLANIIGDIDLHWTPMLKTMFAVANILDFDVDVLEPSCLFSWCFAHNLVVQLCLPFVMTFMALSGFAFSFIMYRGLERHWVKLRGRAREVVSLVVKVPEDQTELNKKQDATVATFLASVDITYVTIAKYCFDCFKCRTIAGVSVLAVSPNIECHTGEHTKLMILGSVGIIFYVIGYLLYISWTLYHLHDHCGFSNEGNIQRFGFVYQKYELDYYYTPLIAIIRKLLFVLVLVYMNNPAFQVGTLAVVINVSLMIHVYTAPYVETYMDVLFSFLLVALMFEAFGGLMFYSSNLPSHNRSILEWIVIAALFLLVCVFVVIFVMEMITKYQIHFLKKSHRRYVWKELGQSTRGLISSFKLLRGRSGGSSSRSAFSSSSGASSFKDSRQISFELLHTFHPSFVFKCLKNNPNLIEGWDRLTKTLNDYMSDQSETSYLSMKPAAKFWRKLVDRFPEVIDLLAVADSDTREQFNDLVTNLYRNFYLSKKVKPLPLMHVLNWRDHAPMAQWLAIAPEEDRIFFMSFISDMFRAAGNTEAADVLKSKLENGGQDPRLLTRFDERKMSRRQRWILDTLSKGSNPFLHSASMRGHMDAPGTAAGDKTYPSRQCSLIAIGQASSSNSTELSYEPSSNQAAAESSVHGSSKLDHHMPEEDATTEDACKAHSNDVTNNLVSCKSDPSISKVVTFSADLDIILDP